MQLADLLSLPALLQSFLPELADGFQHADSPVRIVRRPLHQAVFEENLQQFERVAEFLSRISDCSTRFQRPSPSEDGEASEEGPNALLQEVVTPGNGGP